MIDHTLITLLGNDVYADFRNSVRKKAKSKIYKNISNLLKESFLLQCVMP